MLLETKHSIRKLEDHLYTALEHIQGAAYDKKAKLYEKLVSNNLYNKIMWGTLPADYIDFAKKAILNSAGLSLDIGCGGLVQTAAIYASTQQPFILIDQSVEMLRIAKARLISLNHQIPQNIELLQADAFHLPFEDEHFDNIVSFGMIHCFEDKAAFVNEALRVLKPGGTFYFSSMTSNRFISKQYMNLLRSQKEFGLPYRSHQILNLFSEITSETEHYMKGSMVFISGVK